MRREEKRSGRPAGQLGLIFKQIPSAHSGATDPFQMPAGVTVSKQVLQGGLAYVFRDRAIGELGRILVQDRRPGQCQISCEVVGDPNDPMTGVRAGIFKPLGKRLSDLLEMQTGSVPDSGHLVPPPVSPAGHGEGIEGKLMQCERCDASVAMLIFAPGATELARFEDYARLMYPEYTRLNLPTWIIGPSLGGSSMENRSADIFQVWPVRGSMERMQPDEFNARIDKLASSHCGLST